MSLDGAKAENRQERNSGERQAGKMSVFYYSPWGTTVSLNYFTFAGQDRVFSYMDFLSKYSHWPSTGFSSKSSQLIIQLAKVCFREKLFLRARNNTYTLAFSMVSMMWSSPSATWMTSSMSPAPIFCSSSCTLLIVNHAHSIGSLHWNGILIGS